MRPLDAIPPLHPDGRKFVAIAAVITLVLFAVGWSVPGWLGVGVTIWVMAFFRNPERVTPQSPDLVISPADGMVCQVADVPPPQEMLGEGGLAPEPCRRVSIFMNVFDVHINRAPVEGRITRIAYVPGLFVNAALDKASEDNERQMFVLETAEGLRVGMTQIAGLVARRIIRFVGEGAAVKAGERVGLIRFGSRVDVYVPAGFECQVAVGQRTVAGETILAHRGGKVVAPMVRS